MALATIQYASPALVIHNIMYFYINYAVSCQKGV